jgi:hypothetical protein
MDLPTRGISAENQVRLEQVARINVQWMINFYSPGIATAPTQPALTQPGPQNHVGAAAQHAPQSKFATTATGNSSIAFEIEELVLSKPDSTPSPASKGAKVAAIQEAARDVRRKVNSPNDPAMQAASTWPRRPRCKLRTSTATPAGSPAYGTNSLEMPATHWQSSPPKRNTGGASKGGCTLKIIDLDPAAERPL